MSNDFFSIPFENGSLFLDLFLSYGRPARSFLMFTSYSKGSQANKLNCGTVEHYTFSSGNAVRRREKGKHHTFTHRSPPPPSVTCFKIRSPRRPATGLTAKAGPGRLQWARSLKLTCILSLVDKSGRSQWAPCLNRYSQMTR